MREKKKIPEGDTEKASYSQDCWQKREKICRPEEKAKGQSDARRGQGARLGGWRKNVERSAVRGSEKEGMIGSIMAELVTTNTAS